MGLGTRAKGMPLFVSLYLGDVLWALMVFFLVGAIFHRKSTRAAGLYALGICYMVEISQLYQADWINTIRATKIGGLTLGYGFLWSDILAYTVGITIGIGIERLVIYRGHKAK